MKKDVVYEVSIQELSYYDGYYFPLIAKTYINSYEDAKKCVKAWKMKFNVNAVIVKVTKEIK